MLKTVDAEPAGRWMSAHTEGRLLFIHYAGNLFVFLLPAGLVVMWLIRLSRSSRDEWRIMAFAPALPLAIWGLWIARDVTRDRTSHNLWPFELLAYGVITLLLVGLFLIARRLAGGTGPRDEHVRRGSRPI